MKANSHIRLFPFFLCLICLVKGFALAAFGAEPAKYERGGSQADTIPRTPKQRSAIARYFNIITDKAQRDSLLKKLSGRDAPVPVADSVVWQRRQNNFSPYRGKIIRNIYYNQLKVFGTQIEDTAYTTSMKLIRFANRLHLNTQEWVIRQSLFFNENDTVNAYKMVDNERFLRNLSFIQDARIYVINNYEESDSVDVVVVTKDLFEYGGALANLAPNSVAANVFNNNLLGAGQSLLFGFKWDEPYAPQWRTELSYSKTNIAGTFTNIQVGYSGLNDRIGVDTGVYEKSYFLSINRPLFASWAKFTGGLTLASSASININNIPDSLYRDYRYNIMDVWAGYNFRNQFKNNGINSSKPNIAIEARQYNMNFTKMPVQPKYDSILYYNDHHFTMAKLVLFRQEFFKTNYFFGFGKTEDIPQGYNISGSFAFDTWAARKRHYTAVELQKYWLLGKNLISAYLAGGSFWKDHHSEDAVVRVTGDYYSNLFRLSGPKLRQFIHLDYIICPNPFLYQPVNINRDNGIIGYRFTQFNNYQRLNISTQTTYYSPISVYGFKVNFYALLQSSMLANSKQSIFKSPFYSGIGGGCLIRNENLPFNTLQISASYLPPVAGLPKNYFIEITTISPLSFSIFALQAPALIQFR